MTSTRCQSQRAGPRWMSTRRSFPYFTLDHRCHPLVQHSPACLVARLSPVLFSPQYHPPSPPLRRPPFISIYVYPVFQVSTPMNVQAKLYEGFDR